MRACRQTGGPAIVSYGPIQEPLTSSDCIGAWGGGVWMGGWRAKAGARRHSVEGGTLVNRLHSRGIKEALHRFVLEAVLLICLPTNECTGPVFLPPHSLVTDNAALKARIIWQWLIPREWRALGRVWVTSSLNLPH